MRTFSCRCGQRLFFDNTRCLRCGRMVGWCPGCNALRGLDPAGEGVWRCTGEGCGRELVACHNYAVEHVCNRMVERAQAGDPPFCDGCRHNRTVPDSSVPGNREKWARLEAAKRRLLYTLDLLGLPYGAAADGLEPPLQFDFKAALVRDKGSWHQLGPVEQVYTGHASGRITINLDEADDAEREKRRIDMNEAHRTLVGHFRHEIAHYYWEVLVRGRCEDTFRERFGDHDDPPYGEALKAYYDQGPPADWHERHVSAYATMHPWEDFAETFALYLDMVAVLDTAHHWDMTAIAPPAADLDAMVSGYTELGFPLNELNREMGLLDVVPEVLVGPVVTKLRFIDELVRGAAGRVSPAAPGREAPA
ncbi:MAG: putative zinc-binding metallopeptidase [Halofilum sp. (in: g-proteobacteria)]|nr:putative zinc-binding metallopeptidase [Halofilum sp. (in: g-proteobacteria)]